MKSSCLLLPLPQGKKATSWLDSLLKEGKRMAAGLASHLSSTPLPTQQHVLEGMILSVARACLPLASPFLSICRCNWRPMALQDTLLQQGLALH